MNFLSWLKPNQSQQPQKHIHSKITHHCCSDNCNQPQICAQCIDNHKTHRLMQQKKYRQVYDSVLKQIKWRRKIEDTIREFHQNLVAILEEILEKQAIKFLNDLDKQIYSKNFMEIYHRDLDGKKYSSYLPDFQKSIGEEVSNLLQRSVKEKQKVFTQEFKQFVIDNRTLAKQFISVGLPKMGHNPNLSKLEKVKSLIPFQCRLTCKFQASKHRFQADKLHKLSIRGPILLIAQSYKGKIFGGFSPKMFPKSEHYQQDNRCRSFLFSLDHRVRLPIKQQYNKFAIKGGSNLWFGRGDLVIADQCNKGNISWAQIGRAYQLPPGVTGNTDEWLAGALYFQLKLYPMEQDDQQFQEVMNLYIISYIDEFRSQFARPYDLISTTFQINQKRRMKNKYNLIQPYMSFNSFNIFLMFQYINALLLFYNIINNEIKQSFEGKKSKTWQQASQIQ